MQIIRSCESHLHVDISRVTLTRRKRTKTSLFGPPFTSPVQSQVSWHDNKHFPAYRNYSNSNNRDPFSHRKQPRRAGGRACEHTVYSHDGRQMLAARGHGPNQTVHLTTSQKNDFTRPLRRHGAAVKSARALLPHGAGQNGTKKNTSQDKKDAFAVSFYTTYNSKG